MWFRGDYGVRYKHFHSGLLDGVKLPPQPSNGECGLGDMERHLKERRPSEGMSYNVETLRVLNVYQPDSHAAAVRRRLGGAFWLLFKAEHPALPLPKTD
jgi:hypothetical protein